MGYLFILVAFMTTAPSPSRPNVVLVMTDDQGYGDLACHGNKMIRTPHLDKLHAESVRLTDFHVDPTCSPTRAALMTGRYSTKAGVWHTLMARSHLDRSETTMAELFARAGYRCGIFGKWHLGDNGPYLPWRRGFHDALIHNSGGMTQTPDYWGNTYFDPTLRAPTGYVPTKGYCTDVLFDRAISFMEQNKDKPFFLYLPTNVPHSPYEVAPSYRARYATQGVAEPMANFYGMIEEFDENFGRLRAAMRRLDLEKNTILIYMTDNGSAAGAVSPVPPNEPGRWPGYSAGMRAGKGSHYDGGHRVPCFIRYPASGIEGGRNVDRLAAHFDILPTLAELCSLTIPESCPRDGRSLVPLLRGGADDWKDRTLFVHVQREVIPPKWTKSAAMTEEWRLVEGKELYAIERDPGQREDVATANPAVVAALREEYERWWSSLAPAFSRDNYIPIDDPQENPTPLCGMDWRSPTFQYPVMQDATARLPLLNGYWLIEATRPGAYTITLRHLPEAAQRRLRATTARLTVADQSFTASVPAGATSVSFRVKLPAFQGRLQTWLEDEKSGESRGAFYVSVARED